MALFFQTVIVNRGNSCKSKPKKKTFLSFVSEQSYITFFSKFSKRTNLELIFTFASQSRLLELLSYGEYNQLFISVVCF